MTQLGPAMLSGGSAVTMPGFSASRLVDTVRTHGVTWLDVVPSIFELLLRLPEELARVIDNMVDNAVKYTPEDGSVEVAMAVSDDEVSVVVTDTGLGISATDQAHVFSAFHRSTNPNALSVPGTGLGLPIAQRIAESHGGTLSVSSQLGQGSTFTFTLPLRSTRDT